MERQPLQGFRRAMRRAVLPVFAAYRVAKHWKLQGYGLAGFSDGSPDYGGGASLKYQF